MTASLWVLLALLVGFSLGEMTQKVRQHPNYKKGHRTLDYEVLQEESPVLPNAEGSPFPLGADVSNIQYLLGQLNENVYQRIKTESVSCGGCCGGCCGCGSGCSGGGSGGSCGDGLNGKPSFTPNKMPENDGDLHQMILQFYQSLKNDITGLSQGVSQCCPNAGRNTGQSNITSLLNPIVTNQQVIINDLGKLIKTVTNYIEVDQARLKKKATEWEMAAAQFQTGFEQLRVEMVRQFKKVGDRSLCPVNPSVEKFGNLGEETWRITQAPVFSRRQKNND